jgi:hypothetical protein
MRGALLASVALVALMGAAQAETRRVAVIVGDNRGADTRPPLRFAEEDALRMAAVLAEVGGFATANLFVLRAPTASSLRQALDQAATRVAEWHRRGDQVVALFYFSGHSDGAILELGREGLPFGEVRRWLERTRADVRIGVVDTCKSGALLAAKGGTLAPAFDIHVADLLGSSGDVLITSSAASEVALESADIGASFFSHHLVSGLRGAADLSGDGLVTLAEAYQYAFGRTVSATADTIAGPQHPGYDFHLSGRGDLVLTEIRLRSAGIEIPADLDRVMIRQARSGEMVAELAATTARRIAVPPGQYQVYGWRGGAPLAAVVNVAAGEIRSLRTADLRAAPTTASLEKGGPSDRGRLFLGIGARRAVAADLALMPAIRLLVRGGGRVAPVVVLDLASGYHRHGGDRPAHSFRETHAVLLVGLRLAQPLGPIELGLGGEVGGGAANQRTDGRTSRWTALATVAANAGARLRLGRRAALALEVQAPVTVVRADAATHALWIPGGWLGLETGW